MQQDNQADFADIVAQAVIDKIEERDKVASLVDKVVARVMDLQKQEALLKAAQSSTTGTDEGVSEDGGQRKDGHDGGSGTTA